MDNILKKQKTLVNKLWKKRKGLASRLVELAEDEKVKEYIQLSSEYEKTKSDYRENLINYTVMTYENCEHLFGITKEYDDDCNDHIVHYGCIKCGFNTARYNAPITIEDLAGIRYRKTEHYHKHVYFYNTAKMNFETEDDFQEARKAFAKLAKDNPELSSKEVLELLKLKQKVIKYKL